MKDLLGRTQPICRVLPQTEAIEIKKIIGKDNYKLLLDDMANYSNVSNWIEGNNYTLGNKRKFQDITYELIVANNTTDDEPDCSTEWRESEIFETECYNEIWIDGRLREIMCWYVYAAAVPFYPQILSVAGWVVQPDKSMKENLDFYLNHTYHEIRKLVNEFKSWYEDLDTKCLNLNVCETGISGTKNKTHRKTAW